MSKKKILIVEDELVNRKVLRKILTQSYDIIETDNGNDAWEIIFERRKELSAVLLDIVIPGISGYDVLKRIKEAHMEDLPVIVTTSATDEKSEHEALDNGAWDYISKPYNATVLLLRIKNSVARGELAFYERLQYVMDHDELTGFYNRNKMFTETRKMLNARSDKRFIFARVDIDSFGMFNSSFGEDEGNRLLIFFASRIAAFSKETDICVYGHLSADIFCVCTPYSGDRNKAVEKVEALQKTLSSFRNDYRLEISVGVCEIDDLSISIEEYYYRASIAAQHCKNRIDFHIFFYNKSAGEKKAAEIAITNQMQNALDERQFVIYLQPKFCLPSESVCGAEALVRWKHPTKGMISPGAFIPVFEKNGFIAKLDYYVWEETCRLLSKWKNEGKTPYPVSVNISRVSLYNPMLAELMTELVRKYEISPSLLQLEVTESAYMSSPELMEKTISNLHESGFTILMDDFGSGFSSLNTLKTIRVDVLKIDMKFLPVKNEMERGEIILSSIIKMANWLGMTVVVEGVETRLQRDFLEGVGCDCIQGFYYSKPIPHEEYDEHYLESTLHQVSEDEQTENAKPSPHHNITILVIDDSYIDSMVLKSNFGGLYNIHICENAEAGLAYLQNNSAKVRLILLDNKMPGMSGLEFMRHCSRDSRLSVIPKIMITANDTVDDQVEAFKEGAYDYITKPFVLDIVAARIKHVMEVGCRSSVFDSVEFEYSKAGQVDPETGLLNKGTFRLLTSKVLESEPHGNEAFMIIDIDNFKHFTEIHGAELSDKVLVSVSETISDAFRKMDIVGRFGSDEFVVLMTKLSVKKAARRKANELISEILSVCAAKFGVYLTISIGITFSQDGDTNDTLFARADQALYTAKSTGKCKSVIYGEEERNNDDDIKPVVLIFSVSPRIYPSIAFACGDDAVFVSINAADETERVINEYKERIKLACIDVESEQSEGFRLQLNSVNEKIPFIAICREGNMEQLKQAVGLNPMEIISLPSQMGTIQKKLSAILMRSEQIRDTEQ